MKVSNAAWKARLAERMPASLAREVDIFEAEIGLRKQGKLDEKLFAETRLRRGVYGQRYDNGQRSDGRALRRLPYPEHPTKGPQTLWDAPGMQRIKIPGGGLNAAQLETVAELAEEYSDGIAHVTTRQDFQLHYVHIENTPALMRRLAAAGITTREACGNSVRNVTACPYAGVCPDEIFDVSPYATRLAWHLIGHPDCQDFGRKFKPAFSGCGQHACGLAKIHDLGFVAAAREENGAVQRGFQVYAGGGLGAVPYQAQLLSDFVPVSELMPLTQAVARVYARWGEKKNRNRARLKFLIQDFGMEKFRRLVFEERERLADDPRWTDWLAEAENSREAGLRPPGELPPAASAAFRQWLQTNTRAQKQPGYASVTIKLPLGDITAHQLRRLADIVRRFTRETVRTTVEQNFLLRWISLADLPALHAELEAARLAEPGAGGIADIVTCPGTDTCKLGISSSRGLAAELRRGLAAGELDGLDEASRKLRIKISGCFNSCGQHHLADLGFYGVSRKAAGHAVPHFQVVLGGEWDRNGGAYGLPVAAVPSKNIPEVVRRLTRRYQAERRPGQSFREFTQSLSRAELKAMLDDLTRVPAGEAAYLSDWGDPRVYTLEDIGKGECAGEVVSLVEFDLAAAERQLFEAQLALEREEADAAGAAALAAMLQAAKGLVRMETDPGDDPARIVAEFRARFYDTRRFFDPYAGGKFAHYLFSARENAGREYSLVSAEILINEAQLFLDACHSCYNRELAEPVPV